MFVAVKKPIRVGLHLTDTETANLPFAATAFDDARVQSLKMTSFHENEEASKVPMNQRELVGLKNLKHAKRTVYPLWQWLRP